MVIVPMGTKSPVKMKTDWWSNWTGNGSEWEKTVVVGGGWTLTKNENDPVVIATAAPTIMPLIAYPVKYAIICLQIRVK